ncbi:orotidine-5'-phosphate decarboxylase [Corynebacterium amycolatum]|uniref:orotidine-5'-phosphate decarboxylase n=1 Tax=Corynebacterium amycolatum TaxID=43765 RepID=UPI000F7BF1F1|nr:orotidine-5'-phosphate decarboxylase [Corynebacterium amycolatum]AYX81741.1 orotidine-5'-phosphate decarboxylase [Corynebacterium jeikeium]MCT1546772.1 orotidine-5'-phosphate decarboxylase [Corynebacterium amycolatum]MDK8726265.1 orotidine-5'-phosphate decarboxylase [Corynebacterium amycolatum]
MTAKAEGSAVRTVKGFGDRLSEVVAERGRLCVGIDPHPGLLDAWQLPHSADGLERFAATCVEAFGDIVAVVKPQVAFFEAYGSKGFAVLERTLADLKDAGALSIADAKRGDIGSTMAAYADAWLSDSSPLAADALTVSPYLGFGALDPAFSLALENGRGLFVLAATSNPEGASVQKATVSGESLAQTMVNQAAAINARQIDAGAKAGSIGVVVGATLDDAPVLSDLRGPILMPGVGAQGGTPADVDRLAGESKGLALPSISRAILSAGPDPAALRRATIEAAAPFLSES